MCEEKKTGYPSIDKPWLKYYDEKALHAQPAACTVYQNIYRHNKEHLNDTALEYFGVKISFSKLFEQVEVCAKALLHNGVRPGDCVTLCTSGTPEAIYIVLACSKIGALANFVNPMFQPTQIRDRINETNASFLFVLDKLYSRISSIVSETCIQHLVVLPATASLPAPLRILSNFKDPAVPALKQALKTDCKYCLSQNRQFLSLFNRSPLPEGHSGGHGLFFWHDRSIKGHRADKRRHQRHHRAIRNGFSRGLPPEEIPPHRSHLVFQRHFDFSVDAPLLGSFLHSRTLVQPGKLHF